jgi:outer membrane biosynthesis protein TonB
LLLTTLSERMRSSQIEAEGLRTYSLVYSLVMLLNVPFSSVPETPEPKAVALAQAFVDGVSAVLRSVASEYRTRVLAQIQQQQLQQQTQKQQPQTPPPPPPPPSSLPLLASPSPPPPPPPPPSKHTAAAAAAAAPATPVQPQLEDSTMVLIAALSKAGAPSSTLTSLLPFPSHSSTTLLSPSALPVLSTPQATLASAIPPLCYTTSGQLSVQFLLSYVLTMSLVVVHHVKAQVGKLSSLPCFLC